ncbi:imm11 family protein [Enterovibrio norvegicus]|uniref:imm11 family protein n=1 Tax=Enterovibrio norvegicus TaxID=188144 RepID=UPI0013D52F56|nr:DUF1629 domain-containing protein [Enterovibrio norvegicus]
MAVTLHKSKRWLDDTTPSFLVKFYEEDKHVLKTFGKEIASKARVIYRATHRSGGKSVHSNFTRIDADISAYARKIPEVELPKKIISREGAPPYDFTSVHFSHFPAAIISERFAACLMELEPEKHQLSYIVVEDFEEKVVAHAYFWRPMVILDAIDLSSTRIVFAKKDDIANSTCELIHGDGNFVKKNVIDGHLAWADARCPSTLFISDAFLEILSSRQIDDFSYDHKLKEI